MQILTDYARRRMQLSDERLDHLREHPEMIGLDAGIAAALVAPELVIESQRDAEVHPYYRLQKGTQMGEKWMCVVAKVRDGGGFVITAYLTDQPKAGVVVWPLRP